MTDWQPAFAILLTQASGMSVIHETVFEDRFVYVTDLSKMGADMELSTRTVLTAAIVDSIREETNTAPS